jgi:hypothetical protein
MTRTIPRIAAGIMVGLGIGAQQLHAAGDPMSSCLTDVDQGGRAASHIKQLVLRRDSTYLAQLGLLPADPSDVALVTDSATCDAALSAYNAHMSTKTGQPVAAVFVVKAGTNRFAVLNPSVAVGEFTYFVIFDSSWTFIHEFAGQFVAPLKRPALQPGRSRRRRSGILALADVAGRPQLHPRLWASLTHAPSRTTPYLAPRSHR